MYLLDDIRDPGTPVGKIFFGVVGLLLVSFLSIAGISGLLLYRICAPERRGTGLNPNDLLSKPDVVSFTVPGEGKREAWFFPGLTSAPTIILCHGYQSHRGEILTLVSALQEHQYNVLVFDFSGHGSTKGYTTLGYRETRELLAAVNAIGSRDDVDRNRIGIWGPNMGGYAALVAAAADKRVRAVVADSVYDTPAQMLEFRVEHTGMAGMPLVSRFTRWGFLLFNFSDRKQRPLAQLVPSLSGATKLFIQGRDNPQLAQVTLDLFTRAAEPKQQALTSKANYTGMMEDEKHAYENQVVSFFLLNLPPVGGQR